jgi:hypothetical protein
LRLYRLSAFPPAVAGSGIVLSAEALTVAGQWRILTALPITRCRELYLTYERVVKRDVSSSVLNSDKSAITCIC